MDENNLQLLLQDTYSLLKGVAGGVKNHPLLCLSHQPFPLHTNAHTLIHVLYIFYLPLLLPPPHDPSLLLCIYELSYQYKSPTLFSQDEISDVQFLSNDKIK